MIKKISFSQVVEDKGSFMIVVFMTISINGLIFYFIREYGCHVLFGVNSPSPGIGS